MKDEQYKNELLSAWEETYKKGQLTFWIFLALRESPKYVSEIRGFIENSTRGVITCEEQSLYRSLRKFYDLEMVDFDTGKGNKGPDRKYYSLTALGEELLAEFIERNINLLYYDELKKLITGENVMIDLSRNLKIFACLLAGYTFLFRYALSSMLDNHYYVYIWPMAGVYGVAILITAWFLGANDPVSKTRIHLAFMYHITTYCICNGIALFWAISGFASEKESLTDELITLSVWGFFLLIHFHYSRKSIKGYSREEIFD